MAGHARRAAAALARLPEVDPAIAALALWCQHRDGPGETETRGETIFYGAAFPLLPISEQTGLAAHHVLHVALRHSARRAAMAARRAAGFDGYLYDLACDALVNEALLRGGHALPRPAVRAADLVLRLPAAERPADVLAEWDCDRLYAALRGLPGQGRGSPRAYGAAQGFQPDLGDAAPDSAAADVWTGRVLQALAVGRAAGSGIGAALAGLGDLPRAEIPWERRLGRLMQKALSPETRVSPRRPARAWLARAEAARHSGGPEPVFEPGLARAGARPRLVVGVDTSGSILGDDLALFAAEAVSAVRRTGAEAHLLGFDTEVHHRARLDHRAALTGLALRQGGGTDFAGVLAEAQALDPSLIVVLTDLLGPLPAAPRAPVVWAVPAEPPKRPAFGQVIALRGSAA